MKKLFTLKMKNSAVCLICSPKKSFLILTTVLLTSFFSFGQNPEISVRFANPQIDTQTQTLVVDVEFQSELPDKQLFGMNVRFFYDASVLDFMYFFNFENGYSASSPNPPYISTGAPTSGADLFSLVGPAEYVNGAMQLVNPSAPPVYISTSGWTRLYSIRFQIENYNTIGSNAFFPSIIWDLQENTANGSFLTGSDGVVITLAAPPPQQSTASTEQVDQFNWTYSGNTGLPYGYPIQETGVYAQAQLIANADDFTATPVNGCVGSLNAGNVLANDLVGATPVDPSQVVLSVLSNGGLAGLAINPQGILSIPPGTAAGTYTVNYSICDVTLPTNCSEASVTLAVFENHVECPEDMVVRIEQLPLTLTGAIPEGGVYSGNYVYFNSQTNTYEFHPTYLGDFIVTYSYNDADGCLLTCDFQITVLETLLANIGVRFANPQIDAQTQTLMLDVEFQSDLSDQQLFGMNVRFFYDAGALGFMQFCNFEGGYLPVTPDPPYIMTGSPTSGPAMFSFIGAAEYVNGSIQLVNPAPPVYLSTNGWTKLFSVKFQIENYGSVGFGQYCPSVVWDLEENPENGSFLSGSDGVVITLVSLPPYDSKPSIEQVMQFNWEYSGNTGLPYGYPVEETCLITQAELAAVADDFSATPVNGCVGSLNAGNVLANDLFNGLPVLPSQVTLSISNDGGLTGVEINSNGYVSIPVATPAGMYNISYIICETGFPSNCAQTSVTVAVFENEIGCPVDIDVYLNELPLMLTGGLPEGGDYIGDYVSFNPVSNAFEFNPSATGQYAVTYAYTDAEGCLLTCDFEIMVNPTPPANITVRYANPQIDPQTQTLTLDVEFQSDLPDQQLFGMNVRFFYDAGVLDFVEFNNFEGGYAASPPNPPYISTGSPSSGPDLFTFIGAAEYVNGAVQLVNPAATPVIISTSSWTKLYSIKFQIISSPIGEFCPSVIWDLQQNTANGSFLAGSDGVVITVVALPPLQSVTSDEHVVQFNWEYSGNTGLPYGYPVEETCLITQAELAAVADDFSATPVNGCVGSLNAGNVLANDLFNGLPVLPSQVTLSISNDGGLTGVGVNASGNISVPAGTPAGTYPVYYSICEITNPGNCESAVVNLAVFENEVTCPENLEICDFELPVELADAIPEGGIYSGEHISYNELTNAYEFNAPTCGTYNVIYTYTDSEGCVLTCDFQILLIEAPKPVITGPYEVLLGSTATYSVVENSICNNPSNITYNWSLSGGGAFVNGNTGTEISVIWDNTIGTNYLSVTAELAGFESCTGYADDFQVTRVRPTLAGQVKYWNQSESTMPSPYVTEPGNPSPFDYFYVTLYKTQPGNVITEIETVKVDSFITDDQTEIPSYFEFSLPVDLYGYDDYFLKVWDGGLSFQYGSNPPLMNGTYLMDNYTFNNWGGVNATDVQAIDKMEKSQNISVTLGYNWVGPNTFVPRYGYFSHSVADVNSSKPYENGGIKRDDDQLVSKRINGTITKFPNSQPGVDYSPNFRVTGRMVQGIPATTWPQPFTFTNASDLNFLHSNASYLDNSGAADHKYSSATLPLVNGNNFINIYYTALGDINASYIPQSSYKGDNTQITLLTKGTIEVKKGDIVDIPVRIESPAEIGALTLAFSYDNTLIEVLDVNYEIKYIDHQQGVVNFIWYDNEAIYFEESASIATFTVRVLSDIANETPLFTLSTDAELADGDANVLSNQHLITSFLTTSKLSAHGNLNLMNYPNPFRQTTTIVYNLPESGKVTLSVFNNMGLLVRKLVSEFQSEGSNQIECEMSAIPAGTYRYTILFETNKGYQTSSGTMILMP
ncbi:MAG: hypothetical protein IH598_03745 [Bacteroidales bacterium]|nr:hypothetical protein [Bacteroidales bacterium]